MGAFADFVGLDGAPDLFDETWALVKPVVEEHLSSADRMEVDGEDVAYARTAKKQSVLTSCSNRKLIGANHVFDRSETVLTNATRALLLAVRPGRLKDPRGSPRKRLIILPNTCRPHADYKILQSSAMRWVAA